MKKKMNHRKKILFQFIAILLLSGLFGGLIGIFFMDQDQTILELTSQIQQMTADSAPYLIGGLGLASIGFSIFLYCRANRRIEEWDQEDEDFIEEVERQIETGMVVTEVMQILFFLFLGFVFLNLRQERRITQSIIGCFIFLILAVGMIFLQRGYVGLIQKINPEKRGDALEIGFQKKWIESCDELERMQMYESAYYSFQITQKCFPMGMGILLFTEVYFETGVFPVLVLSLLWLIQTIAYKRHAIKLMRRKGK